MGNNNKRNERLGEERLNYQNCLMKIVEYNNTLNIMVEFQDKYKTKVKTTYQNFLLGKVKNPYNISIYGFGIIGNKYSSKINGKGTKEYNIWRHILLRCFDIKYKEKYPAYKDVTCCEEWLLFENFYEWLHSQENCKQWLNGERWAIDKDILVKGNKLYSPETCCLVPNNINQLFAKSNAIRGKYPIGVHKTKDGMFEVHCSIKHKSIYIGRFDTFEKAFYAYKNFKENIIKKVAQEEYDSGNITKQCYEAMMKYEVEITD